MSVATRRRWLGLLLFLGGAALVAVGIVNAGRLLAAPLEAQRGYVALSVFPLAIGLFLVVGGLYAVLRTRRKHGNVIS